MFLTDEELLEQGIQGMTSIITGCTYSSDPFFTDDEIKSFVAVMMQQAQSIPAEPQHLNVLSIYADGLSVVFDVLYDLANDHINSVLSVVDKMLSTKIEKI